MIDLETTGTDPSHAAIIQIAATRFNYEAMTIGDSFVGYLRVPPNRFWDEDTRDWWMNTNRELLMKILAEGQHPAAIMHAFKEWAWAGGSGQRLWAKPISFEWPFLQSYGRQFECELPFPFRTAIDLNSFCRGFGKDPGMSPLDVPFDGEAHNAVDDVLHQIKIAFMARVLIA